jgi:phage terminase small subunit
VRFWWRFATRWYRGFDVALSPKHRKFCEEYLRCWNATDAYVAVYPKTKRDVARTSAARLLANANIFAEIQVRLDEMTLSANEVLARLAEQARADYKDFLQVAGNGDVALDLAKAEGKTHLIKKISQRRSVRSTKDSVIDETILSLELHDAQAALVQLGKYYKLFTEKVEHSGSLEMTADERSQAEKELQQWQQQRTKVVGTLNGSSAPKV